MCTFIYKICSLSICIDVNLIYAANIILYK